MTPQENQVLQQFLDHLAGAKLATKDPQAQALIGRALEQQPDAGYLLVQRALLLEEALKQSQAQNAQLQAQLQAQSQAQSQQQGASFLGGGNRWGQSPAPVSQA